MCGDRRWLYQWRFRWVFYTPTNDANEGAVELQRRIGLRGGIVSYSAGESNISSATGFGSLFPGICSIPWPAFKDVRGGAALIAFTVE